MPHSNRSGRPFLPPPDALSPANTSLLLDFDGTLVELVDRPDAVVADRALAMLLHRLAGTFAARMALVSGRSIDQLHSFFQGLPAAFAIVGSHGAEFQIGAQRVAPARPAALGEVERAMRLAFGAMEGVIIEPKSLGVALHFRLAPDAEAQIREFSIRSAEATGLMVQEGKMMIELRSAGHDKGSGISSLMAHSPFCGTRPIFIGDDITDEAGFVAVQQLGGFGVLVGDERPTAARFRLANVAAVRAWLGDAI